MKLSRLKELSTLAWEEAKRETIRQRGITDWTRLVKEDADIDECFRFNSADNSSMWITLTYGGHTMLLKQWEAKQIELQRNK